MRSIEPLNKTDVAIHARLLVLGVDAVEIGRQLAAAKIAVDAGYGNADETVAYWLNRAIDTERSIDELRGVANLGIQFHNAARF